MFSFLFLPYATFAMDSDSYSIDSDVLNFYAGDSASDSYSLNATGGEVAGGDSSSDSYSSESGFEYLDGGYTLSFSCTDPIAMGTIVGTGQSNLATNVSTCNVKTDNPAGYKLYWQASAANMTSGTDSIAAYTPVTPSTPETWSVSADDSEWGARLKKSGTTTYDATKWGNANDGDSYVSSDAKWLNVSPSGYFEIVERTTPTAAEGDDELIQFGAEVGSNRWQIGGDYVVDVVMTVTTL